MTRSGHNLGILGRVLGMSWRALVSFVLRLVDLENFVHLRICCLFAYFSFTSSFVLVSTPRCPRSFSLFSECSLCVLVCISRCNLQLGHVSLLLHSLLK